MDSQKNRQIQKQTDYQNRQILKQTDIVTDRYRSRLIEKQTDTEMTDGKIDRYKMDGQKNRQIQKQTNYQNRQILKQTDIETDRYSSKQI